MGQVSRLDTNNKFTFPGCAHAEEMGGDQEVRYWSSIVCVLGSTAGTHEGWGHVLPGQWWEKQMLVFVESNCRSWFQNLCKGGKKNKQLE